MNSNKLIYIFLLNLFLGKLVLAQSDEKIDILYADGIKAIEDKNYISALKLLYAYQVYAEDQLSSENPEFIANLNSTIFNLEHNILINQIIIAYPLSNSDISFKFADGSEVPTELSIRLSKMFRINEADETDLIGNDPSLGTAEDDPQ